MKPYIILVVVTLVYLLFRRVPKGRLKGLTRDHSNELYAASPYHAKHYPSPDGTEKQLASLLGNTQYYLHGPDNGKKIVLIHGLSLPAFIFKESIPDLLSKGFQVLTYDLYGRGYSESPDVPHNKEFYIRQLSDLIEALGWKRFHLLGFSLGGAIATAFSIKNPELISSLILVAPAGLLKAPPPASILITTPYLGDLIGHSIGKIILSSVATTGFRNPDDAFPKQVIEVVKFQIQHHSGFVRSWISTLRHFPLSGMDQDFDALAKTHFPILAIWGENDTVCPFELSETLLSKVPQVKLQPVKNAQHNFFMEKKQEFVSILLNFLVTQPSS